jgi:hypothetical protein
MPHAMGRKRHAGTNGGRGDRRTIYIPADLADGLDKNPDINLSLICKEPIRQALSGNNYQTIQAMQKRIELLEKKNLALRESLFKISSTSPTKTGKIIDPTDITTSTTEIPSTPNSQQAPTVSPLSVAKIIKPPSLCHDCGDTADVRCSNNACKVPLCWACWAGGIENDGPPAKKCKKCRSLT